MSFFIISPRICPKLSKIAHENQKLSLLKFTSSRVLKVLGGCHGSLISVIREISG